MHLHLCTVSLTITQDNFGGKPCGKAGPNDMGKRAGHQVLGIESQTVSEVIGHSVRT